MSRLIDADVLLEHIKKLECHAENKKYEQGLNDFLQCYFPQIIDNQPTAFDTEKVVEQIHDKYCHKCRNILGKQSSEEYCKSVKCEIDALCDIVKKGGVE